MNRTCAALVALAFAVCGCGGREPPPAPPAGQSAVLNTSDPFWVNRSSPNAKVAVVFVHGIFGDTVGTWTNEKTRKAFFELLSKHEKLKAPIDVFAFGFTSKMFGAGSLDVREAVNKLSQQIELNEITSYKRVVFVAHSMGGLIVLRYLISHQDQLSTGQFPLLVLLATPQEGAQIAEIANKVAKNPALLEMFPSNRNAFLQGLSDDWKTLKGKKRPYVACGYEKLKTNGVMIVEQPSATRFCDDASPAIEEADHITIAKPDRPNHDSVVLVVNNLNSHVFPDLRTSTLQTPDFPNDEYRLTNPAGPNFARLVNPGTGAVRYTLGQYSDSSLLIIPLDTPKEISGGTTDRMAFALTPLSHSLQYEFTLSADEQPDRRITVKVADLAEIVVKQAENIRASLGNLKDYLDNPKTLGRLSQLNADDPKPAEELINVFVEAERRRMPEASTSVATLSAATALEAINWPDLSAKALRRVERESKSTAGSPLALHLARVVAARLGAQKVFESMASEQLAPEQLPELGRITRLLAEGKGVPSGLVASLEQIPALRPYGLSLDGEINLARNEVALASEAFKAANHLRPSAYLVARLDEAVAGVPSNSPGINRANHIVVRSKSNAIFFVSSAQGKVRQVIGPIPLRDLAAEGIDISDLTQAAFGEQLASRSAHFSQTVGKGQLSLGPSQYVPPERLQVTSDLRGVVDVITNEPLTTAQIGEALTEHTRDSQCEPSAIEGVAPLATTIRAAIFVKFTSNPCVSDLALVDLSSGGVMVRAKGYPWTTWDTGTPLNGFAYPFAYAVNSPAYCANGISDDSGRRGSYRIVARDRRWMFYVPTLTSWSNIAAYACSQSSPLASVEERIRIIGEFPLGPVRP